MGDMHDAQFTYTVQVGVSSLTLIVKIFGEDLRFLMLH